MNEDRARAQRQAKLFRPYEPLGDFGQIPGITAASS